MSVYVHAESLDEELRVTVDAAVELTNRVLRTDEAGPLTESLRQVLLEHEFGRAADASVAEMESFADRVVPIARLIDALPESELVDAVGRVNVALQGCAIAPSLSAHDGYALHIHWTSAETPFAHQVAVDLLMAVAQTLCDHGTARFGRCGADDCDHVFYDATKNRSRRFCSDPRCASRTHTAAHRARRARDD